MAKKDEGAIISNIELKRTGGKVAYVCFTAVMLLIVLICILPPLWVILSSVKSTEEFYAVPPTIIPRTFEWGKLLEAWNQLSFAKYYMNTFAVIAGTIATSVIVNGLAGYVLSKLKPMGSKIIFTLIMCVYMLPASATMVPVYKNIINFPVLNINLLNTYVPLWMIAGANAFMVIVYKNFFDGIPSSYIEAARLDGANDIQIFTKIMIPLSKPVIFTSMILTFNSSWGDFFWPFLILKDKEVQTVIVRVYALKNVIGQDLLITALAICIIPPIILFMFFQKHIMQGFSMGGIKG